MYLQKLKYNSLCWCNCIFWDLVPWFILFFLFPYPEVKIQRSFHILYRTFLSRGHLHQIACEKWGTSSDENRTDMARMAASAAWGLGKYGILGQEKRLSCTSLCITWVSGALWLRVWFVTVVRYVGQWDSMEEYMCLIPRNSYNGAFYRAVFALHTENYQLAQQVCILSVLNIFLKIDKIICDPILLLWLRR